MGAFDPEHDPVAEVEFGDTVVIETVTIPQPDHRQFLLEEGISESDILENEVIIEQEVTREGPGPHVVTGPIHIADAKNYLNEMPSVLATFDLDKAPHYSSFCRWGQEYRMRELRRLLRASAEQAGWSGEAAIDASGFQRD